MNATNLIISVVALVGLCAMQTSIAQTSDDDPWELDQLSFAIGDFSAFAEVVNIGIKKMALSRALPPGDMDELEREALPIAAEWNIEVYRETDFVVTDLFPVEATDGKDVLIIYRGTTLDEYNALRERKAKLITAGEYEGEARRDIAWEMGRLLSYPDAKIKDLLGE